MMRIFLRAMFLSSAILLAASCGGDPVRGFVARRGVNLESTVAGENSLKSVDLASAAGFRAVQTDCRWTSDSVLVVMAEPSLNRVCLNADFSIIAETVELGNLTLDSLKRGYLLRANLKEDCEPVPTLEEFLTRCKGAGLKVFIHPAVDDSTGVFCRKVVSLADSVIGRENYAISFNDRAADILRNMPGNDDLRLATRLGDKNFDSVSSFGNNTIISVGTTEYPYADYYSYLSRARKSGIVTMTDACFDFQEDQMRLDSFELESSVPYVNYILTDFAAPDFRDARKKGKVVLEAGSLEDFFKKVVKYMGNYDPMAATYGMDDTKSTTPPLKFGAIYLEMTFTGIGNLVVDDDILLISANGSPDGKKTLKYNRLLHDCVPTIMVDELSPDFKILSTKVRILDFLP